MTDKIFTDLSKPFNPHHLSWRIQSSGDKNDKVWAIAVAFVDSRALRDRLNKVVGQTNWQTEFTEIGNGICCRLGLRINAEWIWKSDGAGETQIEAVKGGFSGAFKRACYTWGLGEYLYRLKANFALISKGGKYKARTKSGVAFKWDPPKLPNWAMPGVLPQEIEPEPPPEPIVGEEMSVDQWYELEALGLKIGLKTPEVIDFILWEAERIQMPPRSKKIADDLLIDGVFEAALDEYHQIVPTG